MEHRRFEHADQKVEVVWGQIATADDQVDRPKPIDQAAIVDLRLDNVGYCEDPQNGTALCAIPIVVLVGHNIDSITRIVPHG